MNDIPQITIVIDLGDNKHHYCVVDQAGKPVKKGTLTNARDALTELAARHPGERRAMKVATHSTWVSSHLASEGCEAIVGAAQAACGLRERTQERRSGRGDAGQARKARPRSAPPCDPHLPGGHGGPRRAGHPRAARRSPHLHGPVGALLLKSLGHRVASCSSSAFPSEALAGHGALLASIEPVLSAIEAMNCSILELDRQNERLGTQNYPAAQKLRQIPEVGPLTSLAFVLAVERSSLIGANRDICAYFGIVPRRYQSGNSDKALGISKTGNTYVRTLLVQCAQHILGPHGPESDLRSFGLKLAERGGKAAKRKAIVAVARKLAVLMLSPWKSGEDYRPLRGAAAAA